MTMTAHQALEITLTFFSEEALRAYPNMDRIEKRILALRDSLPQESVVNDSAKPDTANVPQNWAVFCGICDSKWSVPYHHPGKSICDECVRKYATPSPSGVEVASSSTNERKHD
jgi:hypothetical protein